MRRPTVLLTLAALSAGLIAASPLAAGQAAAATESWAWPTSGTLAVDGYGWGHGHGMSQYGAYGAAKQGKTYAQIMAFYYKGTALDTISEPTIRVLVDADSDDVGEVVPSAGLGASTPDGSVADLATTGPGGPVTRWRVVRSASGSELQYLTDTWRPLDVGGQRYHSYVNFLSGTSGTIRLVLGSALREYRGNIRIAQTGSSPNQQTVVYSTVTNYLRSVVPSEMPSSWSSEALKAQAVAARTYALFDREARGGTLNYDTCSTTSCQVFSGVAAYTTGGTLTRTYEAPTSNAAVSATVGKVVTYGGDLAFTQFSASNGGWTTAGSQPYLQAFADPYDGAGTSGDPHHWTDTISASSLQSGIGTLRSVTVTRDGHGTGGGRVTQVVLVGSTASKTLTGSEFASAAGLKSVWWVPSNGGWKSYNVVLATGHWDGDAFDDELARDTSGRLWLHPGTGAASYGPRRQVGSAFDTFTAVLSPGDWNGDGKSDVIARKSNGTLWLYPGNGTGGFAAASQIGSSFNDFTALLGVSNWGDTTAPAADWNGDGRSDLIGRRSDGTLWLYPGNGAGGFGAASKIGTSFNVFNVLLATGDWNGDGNGDLMGRRSDGSLWLYPGNGTGGFGTAKQIGNGFTGYLLAAAGDGNGDGKKDLIARSSSGSAYLYPGNGTGGFGSRVVVGTP